MRKKGSQIFHNVKKDGASGRRGGKKRKKAVEDKRGKEKILAWENTSWGEAAGTNSQTAGSEKSGTPKEGVTERIPTVKREGTWGVEGVNGRPFSGGETGIKWDGRRQRGIRRLKGKTIRKSSRIRKDHSGLSHSSTIFREN